MYITHSRGFSNFNGFAKLKYLYNNNDLKNFVHYYDSLNNKHSNAYNLMMRMYKNNNKYNDGINIFNNIDDSTKDMESYVIGIELYSILKDIDGCEQIFESIPVKNDYIFNSMMHAYNNNEFYQKCIDLFSSKNMESFKSSISCNIALKAYAQLNDITNCERIFYEMKDRDKFSCNAMMQSYNDNMMYSKTIQLFLSDIIEPFKDVINYGIIIHAYAKLNDINNCEKIFENIADKNTNIYRCMMQAYNDNGYYTKTIELFISQEVQSLKNNIICNIAIYAYSKLGNIDQCESIFKSIKDKNINIYNCMMQSYKDNKMYSKSIELFQSNNLIKLQNTVTYLIALESYSKLRQIDSCEILFHSIKNKNCALYGCMLQAYNENEMYSKTIELFNSNEMKEFKDDININIAIIAYAKLNDIENCEKIFPMIKKKNSIVYGCMMQAYNDNEMYSKSIELFSSKEVRLHRNNVVCSVAIQAYSGLKDINNCERIFENIHPKNIAAYGHIMQAYNDNGMYSKTVELFERDEMKEFHDNISCNIAIEAYSKLNDIKNCERIYKSIRDKNVYVYNCMMQAYNDNKMFNDAIKLYWSDEVRKCGDKIGDHIAIQSYSRLNDVDNCRRIFNNIRNKCLVSYSVILNALRMNGKQKKALKIFDKLCKKKSELNGRVFCMALYCCGDMISIDKGRIVINRLDSKHNRHLLNNPYILAAIISLHGKCTDDLNETKKLYDVMLKTNSIRNEIHVLYTAMIDCYARFGDMDNAVLLYDKLKESGGIITDDIYSIVMNCCSHSGNMDKAIEVFNEHLSRNNNIIYETYTLTPIIDGLGRNNQLIQAEYYYNTYQHHIKYYKDKVLMLISILSSCKIHNDILRAERIVSMIEELHAKHNDSDIEPAIYVTLSNIYGNNKEFNKLRDIRAKVESTKLKKTPGISWIEHDGELHEFRVNDKNHYMYNDIMKHKEILKNELIQYGHIFDDKVITRELKNNETIEDHLCGHSEKLALIYGLLVKPPDTTIIIGKNLRICNDCHDAMKLISRIKNRKIMIRDANRYHVFQYGKCSCNDYF